MPAPVQKLTKAVEGIDRSEIIRKKLKDEDRPVLVAFSGGKDSWAATLALLDAGIEVELGYLYNPPGRTPGRALDFIEEGLNYFEDTMGVKVHRYPHPAFYRMLNSMVFQPPERIETILAAELPEPDFQFVWDEIRYDLGLDLDTWCADGVRASDSLVRRASIKRHGAMKPASSKVSPIWDWLQGDVYDYIEYHGLKLPVDYELFGRSFDGIDYRFLKPVKERFPSDYEQILEWFPLAEMEIYRNER